MNQTASQNEPVTITLRWFSVLAEHRGCRQEQLSVEPNTTGYDLLNILTDRTPAIAEYRDYIRLAVNQDYADLSTVFNDGDEVALITPVSGG